MTALTALTLGCGRPALPGGTGRGGSSGTLPDASLPDLRPASCGTAAFAASGLLPDILVVLDASGSMNDDIANMSCNMGCGASSKWALLTPVINQVVMQTENQVNWGLKLFATDMACTVDDSVEIPIGPANASRIRAAIAARTAAAGGVANGSRTPTRAALNVGTAYLATVADTNRKFMLLATDGLANCPALGSQTNDDSNEAIVAAQAAFAAGVPVFVVGITTEGTTAAGPLDNLAIGGGRPRAGTRKYYSVANAAELASALTTLVGVAGTCVLPIGTPPPEASGPPTVTIITTAGARTDLPSDPTHADGWDYTDATMAAIEIFGPACDGIKSGSVQSVSVTYACAP